MKNTLKQIIQLIQQRRRQFFDSSLLKNKSSTASFLLVFLKSGNFAVVTAYAYSLFLTSYSIKWLPYFYGCQALIDGLVAFLLAPYLFKNIYRGFWALQLGFIILTIGFIFLLPLNLYWLPFIFAVFLVASDYITYPLVWNIIRLGNDVMSFKKLSTILSVMSIMGGIVFGLIIVFVMHYMKIIVLPWIISVLITMMAILSSNIKKQEIISKIPKFGITVFKNSLFRKLVLCVALYSMSTIFIDYCFKSHLQARFDAEGIANFMGYFIACTQFVSIFFALFGINYILNRLKVNYLLIIYPIYIILIGSIAMVDPNLWMVTLLAAGGVTLSPVNLIGRELVMSVLPAHIQVVSRLMLKLIILPILVILVPIILIFISDHISVIILTAIFICLLSTYIIISLSRDYVAVLKSQVKLKRFLNVNIADYFSDKKNVANLLAVEAMQLDDNSEFGQLAINFLSVMSDEELVYEMRKYLESKSTVIKICAIKSIIFHHLNDTLDLLLHHFKTENSAIIRWWIYVAVAKINPQALLNEAKRDISSSIIEIKAGAICLLLSLPDKSMHGDAIAEFIKIVNSSVRNERKYAAEIIGNVYYSWMDETLYHLINDQEISVSLAAISAASDHMNMRFVHPIIMRSVNKLYYPTIERALTSLGDSVVPLLLNEILNRKNHYKQSYESLIKVLASIPGEVAESALIRLYKNNMPLVRNAVGHEITYRVKRGIKMTESFKKEIKKISRIEFRYIQYLSILRSQYRTEYIVHEIKSRINLEIANYLYTIAILSKIPEVIDVILVISLDNEIETGYALELLENYIDDVTIKNNIKRIFSPILNISHEQSSSEPAIYHDAWLEKVINFNRHADSGSLVMDLMNKILIIRSVELFEQLPAEALIQIAQDTETIEVGKGVTIFLQNDPPTGLFIVASGDVAIVKNNEEITVISERGYFGELALVDNNVRSASAIAKTNCTLLFIDNATFQRITNDLPEVLRSVVRVLMRYLRSYLNS